MKHANFKDRLVASFLDFVIYLLLLAELYLFVVGQSSLQQALINTVIALIILFNPVFLFYSALMTYYFGGTLGKLLTGLEVVSEDYEKMSFLRILFRQTIGYSFSWIFFGLGFLSIIKDPKKQAWHDKTIGSFVVKKNNLLPLGIFLGVIIFALSIYIFYLATQIYIQGPLSKEIQILTTPKPTPTPVPFKTI